jgi:hypothetical protein
VPAFESVTAATIMPTPISSETTCTTTSRELKLSTSSQVVVKSFAFPWRLRALSSARLAVTSGNVIPASASRTPSGGSPPASSMPPAISQNIKINAPRAARNMLPPRGVSSRTSLTHHQSHLVVPGSVRHGSREEIGIAPKEPTGRMSANGQKRTSTPSEPGFFDLQQELLDEVAGYVAPFESDLEIDPRCNV